MTGAVLRIALLTRAVSPLHGHGGLERHVNDLIRHLTRHRVDVTLITRPPLTPAWNAMQPFGVPGVRLQTVPYLTFPFAGRRGTTIVDRSTAYLLFGERAGRRAAHLADTGAVDLVHGLGASALGYARRHAARRLAPFVFNPQGLEEFGATDPRRAPLKRLAYWPLQAAVRRCARAADRVIATDRSLEPVVRQYLGVGADRLRTVPNAIDLERCDSLAGPGSAQSLRLTLNLGETGVLLLSAGRIEANKGFHVLARALADLARRGHTNWSWAIAGDGPFRPRLQALLRSIGVSSRVVLLGRVDDPALHAWYEAADVFVHPTLYEGSSLVTLEAMAHRRAIVATAAGGLPDKVKPGVNGWLVPPGDDAALADALRDALADRGRLRDMGIASRAIVEADFAWPAAIARLLRVYAELLPAHGALRHLA